MKQILILAAVMTASLGAVGQNGFNTVIPDRLSTFHKSTALTHG